MGNCFSGCAKSEDSASSTGREKKIKGRFKRKLGFKTSKTSRKNSSSAEDKHSVTSVELSIAAGTVGANSECLSEGFNSHWLCNFDSKTSRKSWDRAGGSNPRIIVVQPCVKSEKPGEKDSKEPPPDIEYDTPLSSASAVEETERSEDFGEIGHEEENKDKHLSDSEYDKGRQSVEDLMVIGNASPIQEKPESPRTEPGFPNEEIVVLQPCATSEASCEKESTEASTDRGYETSVSSTSAFEETERSDDLKEIGHDQGACKTSFKRPVHDEESSASLPPAPVSVKSQIGAARSSCAPQLPEYFRLRLQIAEEINRPNWLQTSNMDRPNKESLSGRKKSSKKKGIFRRTLRHKKDKTSPNNSPSLTPKDSVGQPSPDRGYETSLSSTSAVEETERSDDLKEIGHNQGACKTSFKRPVHDEESSASLPPAPVTVKSQIGAARRSHEPQLPEYFRRRLKIAEEINRPKWLQALSNVDRAARIHQQRLRCMRGAVESWRASQDTEPEGTAAAESSDLEYNKESDRGCDTLSPPPPIPKIAWQ